MNLDPLDTECPQCGSKLLKEGSKLGDDHQLACTACGHIGYVKEFLTADARKRIFEAAQEVLREAMKNVPGFKP